MQCSTSHFSVSFSFWKINVGSFPPHAQQHSVEPVSQRDLPHSSTTPALKRQRPRCITSQMRLNNFFSAFFKIDKKLFTIVFRIVLSQLQTKLNKTSLTSRVEVKNHSKSINSYNKRKTNNQTNFYTCHRTRSTSFITYPTTSSTAFWRSFSLLNKLNILNLDQIYTWKYWYLWHDFNIIG